MHDTLMAVLKEAVVDSEEDMVLVEVEVVVMAG